MPDSATLKAPLNTEGLPLTAVASSPTISGALHNLSDVAPERKSA